MEDEGSPPPAIAALGPTLFKLTEVYIGEDGSVETKVVPLFPVSRNPLVDGGDLGCNNATDLTSDFVMDPDDMKLARDMAAWGFPTSFHSTKKFTEKRTKKSKKKGSLVKPSPGVYVDAAFSLGSADDKEVCGLEDNQTSGTDIGDRRVYTDSYHNSNYFYNIKTHTTTLNPLPGMEQKMVDHITRDTDESTDEVGAIYDFPPSTCGFDHDVALSMPSYMQNLGSVIPDEIFEDGDMQKEAVNSVIKETDMTFEVTVKRLKKKSRKLRACKNTYNDQKELQSQEYEEWSININKYWLQRYLLFSKFDNGIEMDEEGWFSVTPEAIAEHHALHCGADDVVIDCFTGVGGNSIQFAQRCRHVIAIDIDPKKIGYAYHNASIYGVEEKIDFVIGDFFSLAPTLKADIVFLSPPWGGPDYVKVTTYDLQTMLKPFDGYYLFKIAKQIARRVIMFLPRNIDLNQLAELSLSCDPPWSVEVEKNYLNDKLKAITAYFSDPTLRGV